MNGAGCIPFRRVPLRSVVVPRNSDVLLALSIPYYCRVLEFCSLFALKLISIQVRKLNAYPVKGLEELLDIAGGWIPSMTEYLHANTRTSTKKLWKVMRT